MERTALLIIDMQNAFVKPESPFCVKMAARTVAQIARTAERARQAGCSVFWILRCHAKDGSDLETFRRRKLESMGQLDLFSPGSYGFELTEGLTPDPADRLVYKKRYSAFFQTDLDEQLKRLGVQTVLVAGTQTPNCVRASAVDAFQLGYRTLILKDCTSSASSQVQMSNLMDLSLAGIEAVDSREILTETEI